MKNVFLIITILLGFFIICKASSHTDTLCNYDSFNVYWGKSDINKKISILDTLNLLSDKSACNLDSRILLLLFEDYVKTINNSFAIKLSSFILFNCPKGDYRYVFLDEMTKKYYDKNFSNCNNECIVKHFNQIVLLANHNNIHKEKKMIYSIKNELKIVSYEYNLKELEQYILKDTSDMYFLIKCTTKYSQKLISSLIYLSNQKLTDKQIYRLLLIINKIVIINEQELILNKESYNSIKKLRYNVTQKLKR